MASKSTQTTPTLGRASEGKKAQLCSGINCPHERQARYLEEEMWKLKQRVLTQERSIRGKNLIFYGIPTHTNTPLELLVRDHLKRVGFRAAQIDTITPSDGPIIQNMLPLIVTFVKAKEAQEIYKLKSQLEVRPILVYKDLAEEDLVAAEQLEITFRNLIRLEDNKFATLVRQIDGDKMTVWRNKCLFTEFWYNFAEKRVVEKVGLGRMPVFSAF